MLCQPTAMAADISPNKFVFPRTVTFKACTQTAGVGDANVCGDVPSDKVFTTTEVVYHVTSDTDLSTAGAQPAANLPEVVTWASSR